MQIQRRWPGVVVHLVECLPSAQALGSVPSATETRRCGSYLLSGGKGKVEFQGHPQLHGEFAIILVSHETPKIFPHAHQTDRM